MKAVRMDYHGTPNEVAYCTELPDPASPAPDEVIVNVAAFPINPADLRLKADMRPAPRCLIRPVPKPSGMSAKWAARLTTFYRAT